MVKVIIIRYGELHLKGNNRAFFEKLLIKNITNSLKGLNCNLVKMPGRYAIEDLEESSFNTALDRLSKISGIHSYSIGYKVQAQLDRIEEAAQSFFEGVNITDFKVETNRADKKFPLNSIQISREIGSRIVLRHSVKVNLNSPQITVNIDVRENGTAFVYSGSIKGVGGMPVGSAGKGMLLLSGGIDSPVAGFMMAKRGMKISAVHFHSYPYTNEQAKEKVIELARILADYTEGINLYIVKFTQIQEEIHKNCPAEMMVTIMRRFMMRISERIALNNNMQCIITGECLGQVASQTVEGLASSDNALTKLSVLRPLIAFDKTEIVEIAEKISTFKTSILPYEDCCTVFLPKHPLIKPEISNVISAESVLDIDRLVTDAVNNAEFLKIEKANG